MKASFARKEWTSRVDSSFVVFGISLRCTSCRYLFIVGPEVRGEKGM